MNQGTAHENKCLTVCTVTNQTGIAGGSCQRILTQGLNMHWIAAKCLLNLLADKQKHNYITVCEDVHENFMGPTCP